MTPPERLPVDPDVCLAAWRFPSRSAPGRTYDVALYPDGTFSCECWPFLKVDRCQHVDRARVLLANEERSEERQAQLDARLGCRHPLTVDEFEEDWAEQRTRVHRECVGCGLRAENRGDVFDRLEADIRERHRLPSSPWSAAERSDDPA